MELLRFGADAVRAAHAAGETAFGENYIQEAIEKQAQLRDLRLFGREIGLEGAEAVVIGWSITALVMGSSAARGPCAAAPAAQPADTSTTARTDFIVVLRCGSGGTLAAGDQRSGASPDGANLSRIAGRHKRRRASLTGSEQPGRSSHPGRRSAPAHSVRRTGPYGLLSNLVAIRSMAWRGSVRAALLI